MAKLESVQKLSITLLAVVLSSAASAWKPKTHIYLADLALKDAMDGFVTIHEVDRNNGAVLPKTHEYAVDPALLTAIRGNRKIFNAGVLGPDAFPDIVTGQAMIHPQNSLDTGSNSWLQHLWAAAEKGSAKEKAFVAGFLFHAAGDMYAHTYINHYAGGPFEAGQNALRHITLEGYLGKLTPTIADRDYGLDSDIEDFIYRTMIDGKMDSELESKLLVVAPENPAAQYAVPRVFSRLKNYLYQEVAELKLPRSANDPIAALKVAYVERWIGDIDEGLKAWPAFSERIARLLVYNLDDSMSGSALNAAVTKECDDFVNKHLLSMAGAPDFVGLGRGQIQVLVDAMTEPFHQLLDPIRADLRNRLFNLAFGISLDDFADHVKRPEFYFDDTLGPKSRPIERAATLTLAEFEKEQLKRAGDGEWKLESFPPAYNTVQMTKLILMSKPEVNRLIADLGGTGTLDEPNAMIGFDHMLDNGLEWRVHQPPMQMALVRAGIYERVFLSQIGEGDRAPEIAAIPNFPSASVKVTITHVRSIDDVDPGPAKSKPISTPGSRSTTVLPRLLPSWITTISPQTGHLPGG